MPVDCLFLLFFFLEKWLHKEYHNFMKVHKSGGGRVDKGDISSDYSNKPN